MRRSRIRIRSHSRSRSRSRSRRNSHLVGVNENVDGRGDDQQEMTELDHDPAPERLVGQLAVAGESMNKEQEDHLSIW